MRFQTVKIENGNGYNITTGLASGSEIIRDTQHLFSERLTDVGFGMAHFDAPSAVVRMTGTDDELVTMASQNTRALSIADLFILVSPRCSERQVLQAFRELNSIRTIHLSTCNTFEMIIADNAGSKNIVGMADDKCKSPAFAASTVEPGSRTILERINNMKHRLVSDLQVNFKLF